MKVVLELDKYLRCLIINDRKYYNILNKCRKIIIIYLNGRLIFFLK